MKLTDIWKRTLKAAPDPVVALAEFRATSEGSAVWWAVPLLVRDVGEFDSVRGAVAMSTEELYASGGLGTAALWLLVPPYPTDPGAWSSVLSLAHRVLADGPGAKPMERLLVRAATLALIRALKESEIVSFDAANVIGGVLEEVLSFISPAERAEAQRDFADVLASLGEPGLRTFMHERANATLNTSACPVFTSADADSAYAVIQSELADATISGGDGLRASLAHVGASLRTFAESQAVGTKGLGAASVRVSPATKSNNWAAASLGLIQTALDALAGQFRGALDAQPRALALGSVEVVARLDLKTLGTNGAPHEDEAVPTLLEVSARLDRILDPESKEVIPHELAELLDDVRKNNAVVEIELRTPYGEWRRAIVTPASVNGVMKGDSKRVVGPAVEAIDVPQANTLARVFRVADLLAAGKPVDTEGLGADIVGRQVDYHWHAARILGLINAHGTITSAGLQIAGLADDRERTRRAAFLFEISAVGRAWITWAGVTSVAELDPETATAFVGEGTKLSGSTVGRRASTLAKWVRQFQDASA